MDQGYVVVTGNAVAEGGVLSDSLDFNGFWKGVTYVLELGVGAGVGYQEAVFVASADSSNDSGSSDGAMDHGHVGCQFGLKNGVKSLGAGFRDETI